MPRPKAPKKANGTLWNKDINAQQETVDTSSSSAPATPPSEPPPLIREPRKRNPPNYKLKVAILKSLQENYKVDDATLDQIAELFHIFARASVLKL